MYISVKNIWLASEVFFEKSIDMFNVSTADRAKVARVFSLRDYIKM